MVKQRVLVLRKIKYGEADLIIHCLNAQGAKLSFLAQGALKSKKRFGGGVLEPTHFIEVQYRSKPEDLGKMITLQEASVVNDFPIIRKDYDRLEFSLYVLDCVNRVAQEGETHSESLFNLLGHSLRNAEISENLQVLKLQFQLKFLFQQGVLQIEPWMGEFLKLTMNQHQEIRVEKEELEAKSRHLDRVVKEFVTTAETDHREF